MSVPPPTEEQLQFYMKNFHEFAEILRWQDEQFFGFLNRLTDEQLMSLVKSQSPVVSALILKFCPPGTAASVLNHLDERQRISIIDQFERTREISPNELKTIELSVREAAQRLPNFILGSIRQELDYWTRLLTSTENPGRLLGDLEQSRPDLYEKLARFRFELPDIPSLPAPLVRRVLDEVENDELARALSHQPSDLVQYVLNELSQARRSLIQNQLLSYQNVAGQEIQKSVDHLTRSFREVLV
jgi:flagellar motor switch protein FliG